MSDAEYDQVLDGLTREEAKPKPAARRAPVRRQKAEKPLRAKRPKGTSQQAGRRADDAYTQVNASIRKELKPSLFFYLKQDGKTLSEIVEDFLEAYVAERGGIIGGKRKGR
jgi:hypothetical protein